MQEIYIFAIHGHKTLVHVDARNLEIATLLLAHPFAHPFNYLRTQDQQIITYWHTRKDLHTCTPKKCARPQAPALILNNDAGTHSLSRLLRRYRVWFSGPRRKVIGSGKVKSESSAGQHAVCSFEV